jgi:hypothetical protein
MGKHSATAAVAAVLILVGAVLIITRARNPTPEPSPKLYFYDLGPSSADPLDRTFVLEASEVPPVKPPSGYVTPAGSPGGVRAYVFACGDCNDSARRFIGFLETYTPAAKAALLEQGKQVQADPKAAMSRPTPVINLGHLVGTPDGSRWAPFDSGEGLALRRGIEARCTDESQPLVNCDPP